METFQAQPINQMSTTIFLQILFQVKLIISIAIFFLIVFYFKVNSINLMTICFLYNIFISSKAYQFNDKFPSCDFFFKLYFRHQFSDSFLLTRYFFISSKVHQSDENFLLKDILFQTKLINIWQQQFSFKFSIE